MIVIVENDQLAQAQMTGQGSRLGGDPFHQVAVAGQGIGMVVDDRVTGAIEARGQGRFGNRHTHGIGQALSQGTGGGLDAGRQTVSRVPRGAAVPLAEALQFLQRQVEAGQMQQGIQQGGPCPADNTKRSRSGQAGSRGLNGRKRSHRV